MKEEVKAWFREFVLEALKDSNTETHPHYAFVVSEDSEGMMVEYAVGYKEIPTDEDMHRLSVKVLKEQNIDVREDKYTLLKIQDLF